MAGHCFMVAWTLDNLRTGLELQAELPNSNICINRFDEDTQSITRGQKSGQIHDNQHD